jgi:hypothetical protein
MKRVSRHLPLACPLNLVYTLKRPIGFFLKGGS